MIVGPSHWKFNALWKKGKPYKVRKGGRGGMKSWEFAKAMAYYLREYPDTFCVICRETEVSLKHSAQKLMWDTICRLGWSGEFRNMVGEIRHAYNGSFVLFKGIGRDPDSIKSMEGADIVWVEEAQSVSHDSLDVLLPTITRKPTSEIWFSYNPKLRTDAVSQLFDDGHPLADIEDVHYTENPYISQLFLDEADELKRKNLALYSHVYLGEYLDFSQMTLVRGIVRRQAIREAGEVCVVGIDIARDGGDETVICVRKGKRIAQMRSYATMTLDSLVMEIQAVIRDHKPQRINVDSTGHGAWVPDALMAYDITVTPVCFSEDAWHPSKFGNKRTEIYALASEYFEAGGVIPYDSNDLEKELTASYYTLDSKDRPRLIPKIEIKKKIGRSPDNSDAFCLSLVTYPMGMFEKQSEISANHCADLVRMIGNNAKW